MTSSASDPTAVGGVIAAIRRPWRRALVWLAILGPFFFLSYGFANWLASRRTDVGAIVFDWEHGMPFLPWSIVPYWSIDLFYVLSLLLPRSNVELDAHAKRLLAAQIISVVFFIAFPLHFTFERPPTSGVFGWMFDVLHGFDKPFNQAPSLHISLLVILWTLYARYAGGIWLWVLRVVAILIGLSVLTTYQHHFIDIPTGVLVGGLAVLLFPLDRQPALTQRDSRRWLLGTAYLAGGVAFAVLALWLRGAWLWLLWPTCSLLIVAGIYFRADPALFRKHGGRMDEAVVVLLAPYLAAAWINSRWWTRKRPSPSEIVPGLWLSRWPTRAEINRLQPHALVDCCAELPVNVQGRPLLSVPMLDLLTPEVFQIERGVAAISTARQSGSTLVFCALGYSRSAVMVVAWLLDQGLAANIDAATAMVRRARPSLVLSPAHIAQLESWYEHRAPRNG